MRKYLFEYDLALDMDQAQGEVAFAENGSCIKTEGGKIMQQLEARDIEEMMVLAGVGCGTMFARLKSGEDTLICRFTMSRLKDAGEFAKIVNFYNLSGKADFPDEPEKRICEKCNRPMIDGIHVCVFCYNKFSVMKRALGFLRPYAKSVTFSQVVNGISLIAFLLAPIFTRLLIERHLEHRTGTWGQVLMLTGMMLFARTFAEVAAIFSGRMYNRATIKVSADLRSETYKKLQTHSLTLFSKRTPGDLIRRIMDDTETVGNFISDIGRWILELMLLFIVANVILFSTNWRLAALVFIPVPIVSFLIYNCQRILRSRFERQWRKASRVNSILHDIIKGIRTVKSFGSEKAEIAKYSNANRELAQISSDNEVLWGLMFPPLGFLIGVGEFLILFFGGWMVLNGTISLGVLVQFNMYLWAIYEPLRWLVNVPRWLANTTTSMVKVFEILDDESEIQASAAPKNVPVTGAVEYKRVYFGYKSYEPVLKGVSLDIKPGEMIGLVGKSGVGKSTLINLCMRLYDPNNGSISINNTDLRDMHPNHLHENMGVVFQDNFLFAGSFLENIAYGKEGATYEDVILAAKAANAHDFIVKSPDGYNTLIGEGGQTLSGGERQRLSIARAIIKDPDILILDEATSSLDVETEASIQESLQRITKNRTTIAIAHRLSTLKNADRLVVMEKGTIAEVGTHAELLRKKGIYYGLVMAQRQSSKRREASGA